MKDALRRRLVDQAAIAAADDVERIETDLDENEIEEARLHELLDERRALVSGVAATTESLLDAGNQIDGESLMTPLLLGVGNGPDGERLGSVLGKFGRTGSPDFAAALARWLSLQPTALFVALAPKLAPDVLGPGAEEELGLMLARLWTEGAGEGGAEARRAFALIAELRRRGVLVDPAPLLAIVGKSFSAPISERSQLESSRVHVDLLEQLAEDGLIRDRDAAEILLEFIAPTLAAQPEDGDQGEVAGFVDRCFAFAADLASPKLLERSQAQLAASPWISSVPPRAATIQLRIAAGLAKQDKEAKSPFSATEIGKLTASHLGYFTDGVILWLQRFNPRPAGVAKALDPLLWDAFSLRLAKALRAYSDGLSPAGRFRLVGPLISWTSLRNPSGNVLRALGIQGADPDKVTAAIVERFGRARNGSRRRAVMEIWRAFEPGGDSSRRKLIKQVFIPLLGEGVGAYELARKNLDLCVNPPHGTKRELMKALGQAPNAKSGRRMAARAKELGMKPSRWES